MSKNNSLITTRTDGPGDRLLIAIQENSMTQKKFAQLIGMSPNGLNSIIKVNKVNVKGVNELGSNGDDGVSVSVRIGN